MNYFISSKKFRFCNDRHEEADFYNQELNSKVFLKNQAGIVYLLYNKSITDPHENKKADKGSVTEERKKRIWEEILKNFRSEEN